MREKKSTNKGKGIGREEKGEKKNYKENEIIRRRKNQNEWKKKSAQKE